MDVRHQRERNAPDGSTGRRQIGLTSLLDRVGFVARAPAAPTTVSHKWRKLSSYGARRGAAGDRRQRASYTPPEPPEVIN